jgi:hypothetical protein
MTGNRVHIRSWTRPDRLVCGRQDPGVRKVALGRADQEPDLCAKCRQRVPWERAMVQVRNAPKPGLQLSWFRVWKEN